MNNITNEHKQDRWGWWWVRETTTGYRRSHDNFFISTMTLYDHEKHSVEAMKNATKLTWTTIVKTPKQEPDCDNPGVNHHMHEPDQKMYWPDHDDSHALYKGWLRGRGLSYLI